MSIEFISLGKTGGSITWKISARERPPHKQTCDQDLQDIQDMPEALSFA
jgi:hypothetical protein